MNPEALPMQRLHQLRHRHRLPRNVLIPASGHAQNSLEFVRENFDKARQTFRPVLEDVLRPLAAGEFEMLLDQPANELHITRLDHRFEIYRGKVASLLGEIALLVEHVSKSAAHARRK